MSQAIILPNVIVEPFASVGLPLCAEKAKTRIDRYAQEVAFVAIILSDNYMEQVYEKSKVGYMGCLDILHEWATQYVAMFAHVEEWEEFLETDRTYGECACWDDHVIAYGEYKLQNYQ